MFSTKVIGLCGGIGSGKSSVSSIFMKNGIPVIDADRIYHDLTSSKSKCLDELVLAFGEDIISCGALNRQRLAKIVFASDGAREKLDLLNSITHKHVLNEISGIIRGLEDRGHNIVVVEVPLLFESGFNKNCDTIISVISPREMRIKRVMERDSISYEDVEARIDSQKPDSWLIDHSDYVINNNQDLLSLENQVISILNKIS